MILFGYTVDPELAVSKLLFWPTCAVGLDYPSCNPVHIDFDISCYDCASKQGYKIEGLGDVNNSTAVFWTNELMASGDPQVA